jgi:hypothetical protein
LQREFTGSRLEAQILKRAFELVLPPLHQESRAGNPTNTESDHASAYTRRSQGA